MLTTLFIIAWEDTFGVEYDSTAKNTLISTPTDLKDYIIPSSVKAIVSDSFYSCLNAINSITFSKNSLITEIDESVFAGSTLTKIDMQACQYLEYINISLFSYCQYLVDVKLPPNIKELKHGCFFQTNSLKSIELPDSVEILASYLGEYGNVFGTALESITISSNSNLKEINSDVFINSKLTYFYIPKNVTKITPSAFSGVMIERFEIHPENENFATDGISVFRGTKNSTLAFVSCAYSSSYEVPSYVTTIDYHCFRMGKVTEVKLHSNIAKIYDFAFSLTQITSITIPSKIKYLYRHTLSYCYLLKSVELSLNIIEIRDNVFKDDFLLNSITLPEKLTLIGPQCFLNCVSLSYILVPSTVKTIGYAAFRNCSANFVINISQNSYLTLQDGMLYHTNMNYLTNFFDNGTCIKITIPSECTSIADYVFQGSSVKLVKFSGNNQMTIGASTFESSNIEKIEFPASLSSLGTSCFTNCTSLNTVVFNGNNFTSIPNYCFYNCMNLKNFILPNTIKSIGISAFENCINIGDINFEDTPIVNISANAFKGSGIPSCMLQSTIQSIDVEGFSSSKITIFSTSINVPNRFCMDCKYLLKVIINDGVTILGDSSFSGCTNLQNVSLPSSIESIRYYTFQNCEKLVSFSIGLNSNLSVMQGGTFYGCLSLVNISLEPEEKKLKFSQGVLTDYDETTIIAFLPASDTNVYVVPSNMKYIGNYAFMGVTKLQRVLFVGSQLKSIGYQSFKGCRNLNFLYFNTESLQTISPSAFEGCPLLHKCGAISCPASVQTKFKNVKFTSLSFKVDCENIACSVNDRCTTINRLLFSVFIAIML